MTIEVSELQRLDLKDGEVLVVKVPEPVSALEADHIGRAVRSVLPVGVKVLIVEPDWELFAVRAEDLSDADREAAGV